MRTILTALTTIVIVASISPVALADLEITVPDITISEGAETGSFEVFITTDETHTISTYAAQLNLSPGSSGVTFTSVEEPTVHPYIVPSSTGFFYPVISNGGATIDVGDAFESIPAPDLLDGAGLFKVNFAVNYEELTQSTFGLTINTASPPVTGLSDGGGVNLPYTARNGVLEVESPGPHILEVKLRGVVGGDGNWSPGNETSTLLLTYELGATTGRTGPGDVAIGWGSDKFGATSEGNYGVYTRGGPFGSGDDMLVEDSRPLNDTANVLIETYTNKVFDEPGGWVEGVTWNEGGTLEFTVLSDEKTFFDDFQIVQKEPGRFLDHAGVDERLGDHLIDGVGTLDFDRIGCDWIGDTEVDWWIGPFAGFVLSPPTPDAWVNPVDEPLSVEMGTFAIGHPHTPEPSSLMLLAIAGFGACAGRRKSRCGQG